MNLLNFRNFDLNRFTITKNTVFALLHNFARLKDGNIKHKTFGFRSLNWKYPTSSTSLLSVFSLQFFTFKTYFDVQVSLVSTFISHERVTWSWLYYYQIIRNYNSKQKKKQQQINRPLQYTSSGCTYNRD